MNLSESKTSLLKVDTNNNPMGRVGKKEAHEQGILHRAFSVFIFNSDGKWLLQKRALTKYHSSGLWTNACCGHPSPEENVNEAAQNRLQFEMGLHCELKNIFDFTYKIQLENNLIEHEYDQVFIGVSDELPDVNLDEANAFRYVNFEKLKLEVERSPDDFTHWFKLIFERVQDIYLIKFPA